jgi:5-formyltetrahydrofolate cyclo-ligase
MRRQLRDHPSVAPGPCADLLSWLAEHLDVRVLAVYSPLPGEVDLAPAIAERPDLVWVYPRISGDHLSFHLGGNWIVGPYGIREPAADSPEIPIHEIDAFLCPGLAFDAKGGRLGRGRGFYDRMLVHAKPSALKIGVCFPFQLVQETFSEPHDIPMDFVIS